MARGTAFSELVTRLRSELNRSESVNVGVSDLPILKENLNTVYQTLYMNHDWPHLKKVFVLSLAAGQRYYNFPSGLNSERVVRVKMWRDEMPYDLTRGIDDDDYAAYDSESNEQNEPAQKWDVKWTGSADQIEIWPIPNTNDQTVRFTGIQAAPRLVSDTDLCLLDDDLVVLFSAAKMLGKKDGEATLNQAQDHLRLLKARGKGGEQSHRMGLGNYGSEKPKFVVRIS